jgi:hypothetical protein
MNWDLTEAILQLELDEGNSDESRRIHWFRLNRGDGIQFLLTVDALADRVGISVTDGPTYVASARFEGVRSLRFLDDGATLEVMSGAESRPTRCVAMLRSGLPLDIASPISHPEQVPQR